MSDKDSMSSTGGEMDTGNYNGFDAKSPGKMSNKSPDKQGQQPPKSFKGVSCNVFLLDGESIQISLDKNDNGKVLFDKVCTHLDLVEKDYFGLTYTDDRGPSHLKYWLNLDKKISKQKKRGAWVFDFALKFYPPDPTHLRESLTRWLIVLQVRRDLLSGRLPCTFTTYALLGSYNVQADVGEHDGNDHGTSYGYIKDMTFAPNQNPELLEKIAELHRQHRGQTPDEAERCFLDNAKKLSMYGVDLHKAKDSENNAIMLGVCASGLLIYRDKLRINRFVWPKILKLSYKRNHFYIKIRPGDLERSETSIMFKLDNHRLAKRLWKTCVEHHAFFRLRESDKPNNNPTFPRFGSKFRYSGRTLYQTRQTAALLDRPAPFFERSQPARDSYADTANRSRSVDELAGRHNKDPYADGRYDPNGPGYDPNDPNRTLDGRDRRDNMHGGPPGYGTYGRDGDYRSDGEGGTLQRRPYDTNEDRRDRLPSYDAVQDGNQGRGDDSMDITAGGMATQEKSETDKERRKREKEEDKRRKKEAEEQKKREEEERKRAEEERKRLEKEKKKKGKESEDRTDRLGHGDATETTFGVGPGAAGLENGPNQYMNPDGTYKEGYGPDGPTEDGKTYVSSYTHPGLSKAPADSDKDKDEGKDKKDKNKVKKSGSFFGRKKKDKHGAGGNDDDGDVNDKDKDGRGGFGANEDGTAAGLGGGIGNQGPVRFGNHGYDGYNRTPQEKMYTSFYTYPRLVKDQATENEVNGHIPNSAGGEKSYTSFYTVPRLRNGVRNKDNERSERPEKDERNFQTNGDHFPRERTEDIEPDTGLRRDEKGYPYGIGLGVGKGDMTGVVGEEGSVDNKQGFLPLVEPESGTKASLKAGYSDNAMPFFHPAATSTVGRSKIPPPVPPKGNHSMDDSFNRNDPPTVATEKVKYSPNIDDEPMSSRNIPFVKTQTRTVTYERDGCPSDLEDGLLITAQSHSSRLKTIETTTYKTEKGGVEEIRVEQKVVMSGDDDDDDFDFDAALSDAIRSVTEFNPDMSVERIECVQQIEDVKDGK